MSAIAPVSGNGQVGVVASADRAAAINLLPRTLPYPISTSALLPRGTLIAAALNGVVSAIDGAPRIEASTQALVHMETAAANDIGGGFAVS